MAESVATPPTVDTPADNVSKQSYDEAKKLAEERASELAATKARLQLYESRERDQLKAYQPAMETMMKELHEEASADTKQHFASMLEWTRSASERPNIDTQMQLGSVIHACASKLKRVREDASVQSATAEQLANTTKELETYKDRDAAKDRRIGELSDSLKEIQANSEKLQLQLEKAGALQEKFDFSKATSREESPPAADANGSLVSKTENASKGPMPSMATFNPTDALSMFVNTLGSGGSGRFTPSVSNHSILGSAGSDSFASAIRPM